MKHTREEAEKYIAGCPVPEGWALTLAAMAFDDVWQLRLVSSVEDTRTFVGRCGGEAWSMRGCDVLGDVVDSLYLRAGLKDFAAPRPDTGRTMRDPVPLDSGWSADEYGHITLGSIRFLGRYFALPVAHGSIRDSDVPGIPGAPTNGTTGDTLYVQFERVAERRTINGRLVAWYNIRPVAEGTTKEDANQAAHQMMGLRDAAGVLSTDLREANTLIGRQQGEIERLKRELGRARAKR